VTKANVLSVRVDAVDVRMALLIRVVIASFTILAVIATTGFLRKDGCWTRGNSG